MNKRKLKVRISIIILLFLILFSSLVIRMGYITFFLANDINILADELWKRDIPIQSSRGIIYDRNGNIIVGNELAYTVAAINKQIKDKEKTAKKLAEILNTNYENIYNHLKKNVLIIDKKFTKLL